MVSLLNYVFVKITLRLRMDNTETVRKQERLVHPIIDSYIDILYQYYKEYL